jgi:1,4-dihydroxy-2-naphthoate octaprenyltransferase
MNFSNILKAWVSTFIGLLIPIITGIATTITDGHVDWKKVLYSLIATALLALTDVLKESQKKKK